MHLKDLFPWKPEAIASAIGAGLWDVMKTVGKTILSGAGEATKDVVKEEYQTNWAYWHYRTTGEVDFQVKEIWDQARVVCNDRASNELRVMDERLYGTGMTKPDRDRFIIRAAQLPFKKEDMAKTTERARAIEKTVEQMIYYGQLDDEGWNRVARDLRAARKRRRKEGLLSGAKEQVVTTASEVDTSLQQGVDAMNTDIQETRTRLQNLRNRWLQ